jgi:mRNA-degrading endonuclease RelE of RelBE toxin-antitoxin system
LSVLRNGTHEVRKTIFETKRQIWKYAIRGRTEDKEVRVIVAFNDEMIIITVIDVKK